MRIYLPVTSGDLATLVAEGRLPGPRRGHAVTSALQEGWPEADEDSWEFAAMLAAGEDSWLARGAEDRPRRHVLALDSDRVRVLQEVPELPATAVEVEGDVLLKHVASAHVDAEDWVGEVDFDEDLAWFATQEIQHL